MGITIRNVCGKPLELYRAETVTSVSCLRSPPGRTCETQRGTCLSRQSFLPRFYSTGPLVRSHFPLLSVCQLGFWIFKKSFYCFNNKEISWVIRVLTSDLGVILIQWLRIMTKKFFFPISAPGLPWLQLPSLAQKGCLQFFELLFLWLCWGWGEILSYPIMKHNPNLLWLPMLIGWACFFSIIVIKEWDYMDLFMTIKDLRKQGMGPIPPQRWERVELVLVGSCKTWQISTEVIRGYVNKELYEKPSPWCIGRV